MRKSFAKDAKAEADIWRETVAKGKLATQFFYDRKYPEAIHSDNLEKALYYYAEALDIRTAADWPLERAVTLLNYVETCWHLNLAEKDSSHALFEQMIEMAQEAGQLTDDPAIISEAQDQLEKLEQLRITLEEEARA